MVDAYLLAKQTVSLKYSPRHKYYPFFVTCLYALLCEYSDYSDLVVSTFLECDFYLENLSIDKILRKYKIDQVDADLYCNPDDDYIHYGVSGPGYVLSSTKDGTIYIKKENPFIACCMNPHEMEMVINTFCHEMGHLIKSRENACYSGEDDEKMEFVIRSGFSYSYYHYYPKEGELQSFQRFSILDEAINCIQTTDALSYIPSLDLIEDDYRIKRFLSSLDFDLLEEDCGYEIVVPILRILWEDEDTRRIITNCIVEDGMMDFLNIFTSVVGEENFGNFVNLLDACYSSFVEEDYEELKDIQEEAKKIVLSFQKYKKFIKKD